MKTKTYTDCGYCGAELPKAGPAWIDGHGNRYIKCERCADRALDAEDEESTGYGVVADKDNAIR